MGQEAEHEQRLEAFSRYQINETLVGFAKPSALVMHCLPAHRGEEITDAVLDGPQSHRAATRRRTGCTRRRRSCSACWEARSMTPDPKRVVLAYSGGLDTSVILRWLIERYRCDVVAFCADLGPGRGADPRARQGDADGRRRRAHRRSARGVRPRLHLSDAAGATPSTRARTSSAPRSRGRSSPRPRSRSRAKEGADAVAHGATGKGNDQVRFELTYAALAPAPARDRAVARVGAQLAHVAHRVRAAPRHPGPGDGGAAVQHRSQPLPHLATRAASSRTRGPSRRPRCSSSPAIPEAAPDVPADARDRVRARRPGRRRRRAARPGGAARRG